MKVTVEEHFSDIDEDELFVKAEDEDSTFFSGGLDLFRKVKDKSISEISTGQFGYLEKIEKALT